MIARRGHLVAGWLDGPTRRVTRGGRPDEEAPGGPAAGLTRPERSHAWRLGRGTRWCGPAPVISGVIPWRRGTAGQSSRLRHERTGKHQRCQCRIRACRGRPSLDGDRRAGSAAVQHRGPRCILRDGLASCGRRGRRSAHPLSDVMQATWFRPEGLEDHEDGRAHRQQRHQQQAHAPPQSPGSRADRPLAARVVRSHQSIPPRLRGSLVKVGTLHAGPAAGSTSTAHASDGASAPGSSLRVARGYWHQECLSPCRGMGGPAAAEVHQR